MNKRRRLGLIVVLGVAITAAAFFALRPREPVCQGKRLSVWLRELDNASLTVDSHNQAVEAVRQIGAKGLPTLDRMLRASDPWLKRKIIELSRKQSLIRFHLTTEEEQRRLALRGIETLGPLAEPLVPMLIEMLSGDTYTMATAMRALARIGPAVMAPLAQALTNTSPHIRGAAIETFLLMGSNAHSGIPAILQHLDDPDSRVRASAAMALGVIGKEPTHVVPALTSHLSDSEYDVRAAVAEALGRFGSSALPALPALMRLQDDTSQFVRATAASAMKQIKSEAAARAECQ